jgi:hypothetical protein
MDYADRAEALIARNRALVAEAAVVRMDVQRRLIQVRAARGSHRQHMVNIEVLRKQAQEAASDAAERVARVERYGLSSGP